MASPTIVCMCARKRRASVCQLKSSDNSRSPCLGFVRVEQRWVLGRVGRSVWERRHISMLAKRLASDWDWVLVSRRASVRCGVAQQQRQHTPTGALSAPLGQRLHKTQAHSSLRPPTPPRLWHVPENDPQPTPKPSRAQSRRQALASAGRGAGSSGTPLCICITVLHCRYSPGSWLSTGDVSRHR